MKVTIDKDKCYMSGECYYNHPELFKSDDEGYPIVLIDEIKEDVMQKHARDAIEPEPIDMILIQPKPRVGQQ